jgi:hypothetical protein
VMLAPPIKESKSEEKDSRQMEELRRRNKARAHEDEETDPPPPVKVKKRKPLEKDEDTAEAKGNAVGVTKTDSHVGKKSDDPALGTAGTANKEAGT